MRGFKNPPLPGEGEPDSLATFRLRYMQWLAERGFSPDTIEGRARDLYAFIVWAHERGLREPREITRPILERYQRHLYHWRKDDGDPLSFRTQAGRLKRIAGFFRWLARQNYILSNPASDLDYPRVEQTLPSGILSEEEVEQVMAVPDLTTPLGLRDRAILEMFYSTAIRRGEMTRVGLYDVDFSRSTLLVDGKGKRERYVPLAERTKAWVRAYCDKARPELVIGRDPAVLFLTATGLPLTKKKLSDRMSDYIVRSGVPKAGACHIFRHTAATLMLEGGADIRIIQQFLGHASLNTTEIYTRVAIKTLQDAHAASHPGAKLTGYREAIADLMDDDEDDGDEQD